MAGLESNILNTVNSEINNIWGYNPNTISFNRNWTPGSFTSNYGGLTNLGGQIVGGLLDNSAAHQRTNGERSDVASITDTVGNVAGSIFKTNPVLSGIGRVATGAYNKITGGTDGMTTVDAALGSGAVQGALAGIAATTTNPVGWGLAGAYFLGSALNSLTGKTTMKDSFANFQNENKLSTLDSAYYRDSRMDNLYNKKYGGFSLGSYRKAQNKLKKDQWEKATKLGVYELANLGNTRAGMVDANLLNYLMNVNGGYTPTYSGKHGLNTEKLFKARELLKRGVQNKSDLKMFQNGGTMNVIPEGALHARKHNMENSEHITKKGIPVVDNEGNQQAEIERNEIIFRKEVTDELERLRKDGSDEAAIEAGKLLTTEIMENTEDRTGLIKELTIDIPKHQPGGSIKPLEFKPQEFKFPDTSLQTSELDAQLNTNINSQKSVLDNMNSQQTNKFQKMGDLFSTVSGAINDFYNLSQRHKTQSKINQTVSDLNYLYKKEKALNNEQPLSNEKVNIDYNPVFAQEGTELKELPNFTYSELLEYLKDRNDDDYDLEKAFQDKDVYEDWRKEEEKNPGKGHWSDKYKKPNHMTYSIESILGDNPKENGGIWVVEDGKDVFITSPYLEKLHSLSEYLKYFKSNEPGIGIKYKGKTYFAK